MKTPGNCPHADLTRLYLRLLYSETEESRLFKESTHPMHALLPATSVERLQIERGARIRNLASSLTRQCEIVMPFLPDDARAKNVAAFANSAHLWQGNARCLAEAFCLYLAKTVRDPLVADVARLQGVCLGLGSNAPTPTPWIKHVCAAGVESFATSWPLLLRDGAIPKPADRETIAAGYHRDHYRLEARTLPDGTVDLTCTAQGTPQ